MTRKRKPRQRHLVLDMTVPLHPVDYERGRQLLARIRETLARQFAAQSK